MVDNTDYIPSTIERNTFLCLVRVCEWIFLFSANDNTFSFSLDMFIDAQLGPLVTILPRGRLVATLLC